MAISCGIYRLRITLFSRTVRRAEDNERAPEGSGARLFKKGSCQES